VRKPYPAVHRNRVKSNVRPGGVPIPVIPWRAPFVCPPMRRHRLGSGLDGIRWSTTPGKWQVQWFSLAGVVAQARSVLPEGVFELARMTASDEHDRRASASSVATGGIPGGRRPGAVSTRRVGPRNARGPCVAPCPAVRWCGVRSRTGPAPDPGPGRPGGGLALKCCRSAPTDRWATDRWVVDRQPTPNTGYPTHECARPHARPGPLTGPATSHARPADPQDHPGNHGSGGWVDGDHRRGRR